MAGVVQSEPPLTAGNENQNSQNETASFPEVVGYRL